MENDLNFFFVAKQYGKWEVWGIKRIAWSARICFSVLYRYNQEPRQLLEICHLILKNELKKNKIQWLFIVFQIPWLFNDFPIPGVPVPPGTLQRQALSRDIGITLIKYLFYYVIKDTDIPSPMTCLVLEPKS